MGTARELVVGSITCPACCCKVSKRKSDMDCSDYWLENSIKYTGLFNGKISAECKLFEHNLIRPRRILFSGNLNMSVSIYMPRLLR